MCVGTPPCDHRISLTVEDSISGGEVAADSVTAIATDGAFADTVRVSNDWALLLGVGLATCP